MAKRKYVRKRIRLSAGRQESLTNGQTQELHHAVEMYPSFRGPDFGDVSAGGQGRNLASPSLDKIDERTDLGGVFGNLLAGLGTLTVAYKGVQMLSRPMSFLEGMDYRMRASPHMTKFATDVVSTVAGSAMSAVTGGWSSAMGVISSVVNK